MSGIGYNPPVLRFVAKESCLMSIKRKYGWGVCLLALPFQVALAAPPEAEPDTGFDITPVAAPKAESPPAPAAPKDGRLNMSREELLRQPELLQQALSYAVLTNNSEGVALLLPIYLETPEPHDALLVALAQAIVARAEGDYHRAISLYRAALDAHPDMPPVRLVLAQALFENMADKDARQEIERFQQTPGLAPELKQLGDQYLQALDKRDRWSFYGSVNYVRDSNVNNSNNRKGAAWSRVDTPESAQGLAYRAGASRDWNLHGNLYWRLAFNHYGWYYWDNHKYDFHVARVAAGPAYKTARAEVSVMPYFERQWAGTDYARHQTRKYLRETGVRTEWQYWLTPRHKVLTALELGGQKYDIRDRLDGDSYAASGTWLYVRKSTQYFTFGVDWSRKLAERSPAESYTRKGIRAGWTQQWGWGLTTSASFGGGLRDYDAPWWGGSAPRQDRELNASVLVSHRKIQFAGITPQLVGIWQRTNSNNPLFSFSKGNVFIQLGRSF